MPIAKTLSPQRHRDTENFNGEVSLSSVANRFY
jgi:hypothetical protein